jgi:hypothetical protein
VSASTRKPPDTVGRRELPWGVRARDPRTCRYGLSFAQAIVTTAALSCLPVKNRSSSPFHETDRGRRRGVARARAQDNRLGKSSCADARFTLFRDLEPGDHLGLGKEKL